MVISPSDSRSTGSGFESLWWRQIFAEPVRESAKYRLLGLVPHAHCFIFQYFLSPYQYVPTPQFKWGWIISLFFSKVCNACPLTSLPPLCIVALVIVGLHLFLLFFKPLSVPGKIFFILMDSMLAI